MRIGKEYSFEAGHHLPNHKGKCRHPHGHSYRLEVEIEGPILDHPGKSEDGMVLDFSDLDKVVNEILLSWLDHQELNHSLQAWVRRPTAELICKWIAERLKTRHLLNISRIRLWETAKSWAEWTP